VPVLRFFKTGFQTITVAPKSTSRGIA